VCRRGPEGEPEVTAVRGGERSWRSAEVEKEDGDKRMKNIKNNEWSLRRKKKKKRKKSFIASYEIRTRAGNAHQLSVFVSPL
jgi:hypothetical protein